MEYRSDIEIAQATEMTPVTEIAGKLGVDENCVEQYGRYKAKIDYRLLDDWADRPDGKLVLVTAINPTPATGSGKRSALPSGNLPSARYSASRAGRQEAATPR